MESYNFPKCLGHDSYFKKFRTEVNALEVLTETVLSEIQQKKDISNLALNTKLNCNKDFFCDYTTWAFTVEEFYSRIIRFIQTLSMFISFTTSETKHRLRIHGLISTPNVCSLPTVCRMLWRQVENVCRESDNNTLISTQHSTAASVEVTMTSKSNQTENSCLRYCESCQLSTGLIKILVNSITEQQKKYCVNKTHVSEFRKRVVDEVNEMSQWAAMSGWVEAIQQDIKWASEIVALSQTENLNKQSALNQLKKEQKRAEKNLKDDLQLIQTQLAAEKAQNSYLRHQIEDINLALKRRIEHEQSLEECMSKWDLKQQILQKSIKILKSDIDLIKSKYKSLRDFVKTALTAESRTVYSLNENTSKTTKQMVEIGYDNFNKQIVLKTELEGNYDLIDALQKKCTSLEQEKRMQKEHFEKLEAMVNEKMQEENNMKILQQKVEVLEISLEESKAQELLYRSKLEHEIQSQIKISGDPVRDMETQRQLNKQQMKRLLKENTDLKKTIQKLKSMKIKPLPTIP